MRRGFTFSLGCMELPLKKTHQLINKIIFHDSYMGIEMHSGITKQKIYQLLAFTMHHLQQLSLSHSLLIG